MPERVTGTRDRESACATAEACAAACLEEEERVSIMVRNLPNRVKLEHLMRHLGELGLQEACGSIHLPVDPRTGVNKGYAFVSVAAAVAPRFIDQVEGTKISGFLSQKRVSASWADKQRTGKRVTSKYSEIWDRPLP